MFNAMKNVSYRGRGWGVWFTAVIAVHFATPDANPETEGRHVVTHKSPKLNNFE